MVHALADRAMLRNFPQFHGLGKFLVGVIQGQSGKND